MIEQAICVARNAKKQGAVVLPPQCFPILAAYKKGLGFTN
jgi:hypothetical protein